MVFNQIRINLTLSNLLYYQTNLYNSATIETLILNQNGVEPEQRAHCMLEF